MRILLCVFALCSFSLQALSDEGMNWKPVRGPIHARFTHRPKFQKEVDDANDNNPRNRPIPFNILHYALDIEADPNTGIIQGTSTIALKSTSTHLETIIIDAYDMKISSVKLGGVENRFEYDGEIIRIPLTKALSYDESTEVRIVYKAERSQHFYVVGPNIVNPHRMKTAYTFTQPEDSKSWFPCIERPFAKAPFEIKISVPEPFKVLSNGTLISTVTTDSSHVQFHYKVEQAIAPYLVSLAIGNYDIVSLGEFQGKPLTLWTPPLIRKAAAHDTARTAKMMDVFSRFTGLDYPFPAYVQSIAPAWEVSMEHQAASTLGDWVITGDGTDEATILHELAHQWFGNWVTPEIWGDLWLSEGFATYLPYVFYKEVSSGNKALGEVDDWRQGYFAESKRKSHALSEVEPDVDTMFDAHVYEKGALVIQLMRFVAKLTPSSDGEENFRKAILLYLNDHAQKTVRSADLQRSLETVTNHSWQTFFDQWVRSPGHPQLEVATENKDGKFILKIKQTQALDDESDWSVFQFPLPIDLYDENGKSKRYLLDIYDSVQEIELHPGFKVEAIDFDPNWDIPVEIDMKEDLNAWLKIMKFSPSPMSRIRASRAILAKKPVADDTILHTFLNDTSLYLKADALDKLSKKTENRKSILRLIENLHTRHNEWDRIVRNAVAAAQAWLVKTNPRKPSARYEEVLQNNFRNKVLTVSERKSILDKLMSISLPHAQKFAIERLTESQWCMRDRGNLLEVISKTPGSESHGFLKEALNTSNYYWLRKLILNLIAANYDNKEIVPVLLHRAQNDPLIPGRSRVIELLAIQKSSKDTVCPVLRVLSKAEEENPDRLEDVRDSAVIALHGLQCPTPPS